MKFLVIIVTVLVSLGSTNSFSYPIFGTKRYHRGSSPRTEMAQHILRQPVYENGYLTNNGYYYYPHHEYHSYGMPTYHGEYKPKAYYYSAGPSYSYYNDRQPVSNPLDDLHEEIIQENEQERQTDMLGDGDYAEDYYLDPSENQHEVYANNFLRNMVDYNRQKEKHQRNQQLYNNQREQLNAENEASEEHPIDDDYFSELEVNPDDYEFEPKGEANFDLQKYWDAEMSSLANAKVAPSNHYQRDALNEQNKDEDVAELKSLTKIEPANDEEDYKKRYQVKEQQPAQLPYFSNWRQQQPTEPNLTQQKQHDDDYSSLDYDDGSWINWDRKRSLLPKKTLTTQNNQLVSDFVVRKRLLAATKKPNEKNSNNNSALKTTLTSTKSPENALKDVGQKEKYVGDEAQPKLVPLLDSQKANYNGINEHSKSQIEIDQGIYDTIKQMISIEEELKKNGSKKRKRYIADEGSLVSQLDSLRRMKN